MQSIAFPSTPTQKCFLFLNHQVQVCVKHLIGNFTFWIHVSRIRADSNLHKLQKYKTIKQNIRSKLTFIAQNDAKWSINLTLEGELMEDWNV